MADSGNSSSFFMHFRQSQDSFLEKYRLSTYIFLYFPFILMIVDVVSHPNSLSTSFFDSSSKSQSQLHPSNSRCVSSQPTSNPRFFIHRVHPLFRCCCYWVKKFFPFSSVFTFKKTKQNIKKNSISLFDRAVIPVKKCLPGKTRTRRTTRARFTGGVDSFICTRGRPFDDGCARYFTTSFFIDFYFLAIWWFCFMDYYVASEGVVCGVETTTTTKRTGHFPLVDRIVLNERPPTTTTSTSTSSLCGLQVDATGSVSADSGALMTNGRD